MSKAHTLRALMTARLAAATEEVLVLFERTIQEYEEELRLSKEETHRTRAVLNSLLYPRVRLHQAAAEESPEPALNHGPNHGPDHGPNHGPGPEIPEPSRIKEEPEEQAVKQEQEQLPESSMVLCVEVRGEQRHVTLTELSFGAFLKEVCRQFNIAESRRSDMKVLDQSDTEVDCEVFEEVVRESAGTLRVVLRSEGPAASQSPSSTASEEVDLNVSMFDGKGSRRKRRRRANCEAKELIERILRSKPGGERVVQEYVKTKTLKDGTRRQMVKILAAEMTQTHGTAPPKRVRVTYAQGIVALFPNLQDPHSEHGYEHFYDPDSGSGYLAWRLKTIQRKTSEERAASVCKPRKVGGPGRGRQPFSCGADPSDEDVEAAVAVLRHSADEDDVREKMKITLIYRQAMVNSGAKSSEVFMVFPRFLDTPGLIEQDFRLLFGEATANKFLAKWPTTFKAKVIKESHGLALTAGLSDLMRNAEAGPEDENGWDSDMSAILLLLHLLPPSAQGRKRPGKMSACRAVDHLIRFQKVGTSVHPDITQTQPFLRAQGSTQTQPYLRAQGSPQTQPYLLAQGSTQTQPYLLAQGSTQSRIQSYSIVVDQQMLPCQATSSVAAFDELFKAHFVFGSSYSSSLSSFFTFVQTTIYNIDVGETKETPRVAELRARIVR
ncbi:unnamed protein product [Knipowitschia caucasica]